MYILIAFCMKKWFFHIERMISAAHMLGGFFKVISFFRGGGGQGPLGPPPQYANDHYVHVYHYVHLHA